MADPTSTRDRTYSARLRAAANTVEELEEQLRIERDRRNELIVAAIDDEGMTYGQVAQHTRLSRARVIAIIAAAA
jgi:hypothetical protein